MAELNTSLSRRGILAVGSVAALSACAPTPSTPSTPTRRATPAPSKNQPTPSPSTTPPTSSSPHTHPTRAQITTKYDGASPSMWGSGEDAPMPGLVQHTASSEVVLTLDACGGAHGSGVDVELLDYLSAERIPAVLFLNKRWIEANRSTFDQIASKPELFEIGNHGTRHVPLSVTGRKQYGITGTRNPGEVFDEVMGNHALLTKLLGTPPRYFRTGTAWYDDVALRIVRDCEEIPVGFDVNADAGATFRTHEVVDALRNARAGSIIIGHCNQPGGDTFEGFSQALPQLRAAGLEFTKLSDALP